jgi:hypothetical protein
MSRKMTEAEVRDALLDHIRAMMDYWRLLPDKSIKERMDGFAFSILAALDGSSTNLPAFIVAPDPHKEDRDYDISRGKNWFPENHELAVECDLGGSLHEFWHKTKT